MARPGPVQRMRLFAELARELGHHPLLAGGTSTRLEIRFDGGKLETEIKEPDRRLLQSLLLELRPFLLDADDVHLTELHNLAIRHLDDPELVHAIESARHSYKGTRRSLGIKLEIDGTEVTTEQAARLWLNGVYFHHDADKRERLASYVGPSRLMVRYHFLTFTMELAQLVVWTGLVLDEADRRGAMSDEVVAAASAHPHHPHVAESQPKVDTDAA